MKLAQKISSMVLALRKRTNLRVRQPLAKLMIPAPSDHFIEQVDKVKDLILSEVNVKEIVFVRDNNILTKTIKPDFKALGSRLGKLMKPVANQILALDQDAINSLDAGNVVNINVEGNVVEINRSDVEISTKDIPGWAVLCEGTLTVALDIELTEELLLEGFARELVNKIQNIRKENEYEVTDKISLKIETNDTINKVIEKFSDYICAETLIGKLELLESIDADKTNLDLYNGLIINVQICKF